MSQKSRDAQGRWRNKVVAFRMSPEENELLNIRVRSSGLTKQDYIIHRLLGWEIVVQGNPRVFKALKEQLAQLERELTRLTAASEADEFLRETLRTVSVTCEGMMQDGVSGAGGSQDNTEKKAVELLVI